MAADSEHFAHEVSAANTQQPIGENEREQSSDGRDASKALDAAQAEIDALLSGATFEDPDPRGKPDASFRRADFADSVQAPSAVDMPKFDKVLQEAQVSGIDLLRDVNLEVKIELGRSRMLVEDVLKLVEGSVVELDKLAGDPVDVFVNDRLVARGEVLVLNDNFCVRVNEIVQSSREEEL